MNTTELFRELRVQIMMEKDPDKLLQIENAKYIPGWLILYNAEIHLNEKSTFYRNRFGSSTRAWLFPNFKQQTRMVAR